MSIWVAEGIHPRGLQALAESGHRVYVRDETFAAEEISGIVVRSVYQINAETLERFPALRCVAKLGTGLDNIDAEACKARGVQVVNAPGQNAVSTAEFAVMLIMAAIKNAFVIHDRVQARDYRRENYYGRELADLSAGVLGYGAVGRNVTERLRPLFRELHICDRNTGNVRVDKLQFFPDARDVVSRSDVIVLCLSLQGNRHVVDRELLALLRPNALLVNVARGALVREEDLLEFLKERPDARFCCDVLENEPEYELPPERQNYTNPLLELPNVIFTPHIAGMTQESQERIALHIVHELSQVIVN